MSSDVRKYGVWAIAVREIKQMLSHRLYFFCLLVAPAVSVLCYLSLMRE
jgi:ABC-2 type transport system permease protein